MNPVLHEGAEAARLGILMGLTTVGFLAAMVGWTMWAWLPSRRAAMEEASMMPFEED